MKWTAIQARSRQALKSGKHANTKMHTTVGADACALVHTLPFIVYIYRVTRYKFDKHMLDQAYDAS